MTISFSQNYKEPPKVFGIANNRAINVSVGDITENGCTLGCTYISGSYGKYEITYFVLK